MISKVSKSLMAALLTIVSVNPSSCMEDKNNINKIENININKSVDNINQINNNNISFSSILENIKEIQNQIQKYENQILECREKLPKDIKSSDIEYIFIYLNARYNSSNYNIDDIETASLIDFSNEQIKKLRNNLDQYSKRFYDTLFGKNDFSNFSFVISKCTEEELEVIPEILNVSEVREYIVDKEIYNRLLPKVLNIFLIIVKCMLNN